MNKIITEELINERLEAKGFGEKQINDEELARKAVLKYYGVELTNTYGSKADFNIYEESTVDGYTIWIATHNTDNISISEDVHYYDGDLNSALVDFIKYSNGDEDFPEIVYVDDLSANFIDYAIEELFTELAEKFEEEITNELIDEGYEEQD